MYLRADFYAKGWFLLFLFFYFLFFGWSKNQSHILPSLNIDGEALEALWDKSRYKSHGNFEPFLGWKKTLKGKPPGIGCE